MEQQGDHKMTSLRRILMLLVALTMVSPALPAVADVNSNVLNTIKLSNVPLDIEVALNGQRIYILDDKGALLIYGSDGVLMESLKVDKDVTQIKVGARDDVLYLLNPTNKTAQILDLTFTYKINTKGAPMKGPKKAPVTIAVFSDFQCPYCARIGGIIDAVLKEFPDKVNTVFKFFPLRSHRYAKEAAKASVAAMAQGKFWEYHDLIFKDFRSLNEQKLEAFAEELKLDMKAFKKTWKAPETETIVNNDAQEGIKVGVQGTPSVFVNGELVRPANFEGIKAAVEKALKQSK